jgi:hypothetical protein
MGRIHNLYICYEGRRNLMTRYLLLIIALLSISFLSTFAHLPLAEAVPDCEAGWCEDTFEAGGEMHDIGYLEEMTNEAQAAREAVIKSFEVLQPIWGVGTDAPFRVSITVLPSSPGAWAQASGIKKVIPEIDGNASVAIEETVCHIEMFNIPDAEAWLPSIAHEMAHCFQDHYIDYVYTPPDVNWWVEGSAEWLATLVYPEMADNYLTNAGRKALFASDYVSSLYRKSYDSVFFWHFLESYLGRAGVVNFLMDMPPAATSMTEYHDYLKSALPDADDAMQQFAIGLFKEQVPYQPMFVSLQTVGITPPLPFGTPLSAQTFGFEYWTIENLSLPQDKALRVRVDNTELDEMRATLIAGPLTYWLTDGESVDLCEPPEFTIALSRTGALGSDALTAPPPKARLELAEIDADEANCLEIPEELPACMVGTWYVTSLPEQATPPGVTAFWEPSNYFLTLNEDGTFEGAQLDMVMVADAEGIQSETNINMEFSGLMTLEPVTDGDDQYEVVDLDVNFDSASFIVALGGESVDMTDMILGMGAEGTSLGFKYFTCIDTTHLDYTVESQGVHMMFSTEKAPETE